MFFFCFVSLENHDNKTSRLLLVLVTDLRSSYNLLSSIFLLWKDLLISKTCSILPKAIKLVAKKAKNYFFLHLSVRQHHGINK